MKRSFVGMHYLFSITDVYMRTQLFQGNSKEVL